MNKFNGKVELGNEFFNFDLKLTQDSTLDFDNKGSMSTGMTLGGINLLPLHGDSFKDKLPLRTAEGFTLDFWMDFGDDGNTEDLDYFFYMGSKTGTTTEEINGFGFYYQNKKIGYKSIVKRVDDSGNTLPALTYTETTPNITGVTSSLERMVNVTVKYKRNQKLELCEDCKKCDEPNSTFPEPYDLYYPDPIKVNGECGVEWGKGVPDSQLGKLTILINARPVFETTFEETIFRPLEEYPLSTNPYYISIGEGTENLIDGEFTGIFSVGVIKATMWTYPLSMPEIIKNFNTLKGIYGIQENFGGAKIIVNSNLTK